MSGSLWQRIYLGIGTYPMVEKQFSDNELALMGDQDILLTKRQILSKIADLFADTEVVFKDLMSEHSTLGLPADTLVKAGKISRGENYRGLPYIVLDYPRLLTREDVLNVRLLFWWGHYFTMSLHLSGKNWHQRKSTFLEKLSILSGDNFRVQVEGSPWENDVFSLDFVELKELTDTQIQQSSFIRIVQYLELSKIDQLEHFCAHSFVNFMSILKN